MLLDEESSTESSSSSDMSTSKSSSSSDSDLSSSYLSSSDMSTSNSTSNSSSSDLSSSDLDVLSSDGPKCKRRKVYEKGENSNKESLSFSVINGNNTSNRRINVTINKTTPIENVNQSLLFGPIAINNSKQSSICTDYSNNNNNSNNSNTSIENESFVISFPSINCHSKYTSNQSRTSLAVPVNNIISSINNSDQCDIPLSFAAINNSNNSNNSNNQAEVTFLFVNNLFTYFFFF